MKKLLCMLLVMVLAVCTFAACDLINPKAHEHEYSAEWASDAENHWHAATCDAEEACATAIADQAAHSDEDEDNKCDVCAYVLHTHTFAEGKCECGAEDPNYVAPHTHNYVNGKCECGEYDPAHTHDYGEGVCICGDHNPEHTSFSPNTWYHPALEAATCTTPGVAVFECDECNYYYTEETPIDEEAHGFWGEEEIISEADCATGVDGLKYVYCVRCDAYEEQIIDAEYAHDWDVQVELYQTCTEDGAYYAVCTICDAVDEYTIPAGGHVNYMITCGETGNCWECGVEFTKEHDLVPATCTDPAFCTNCWTAFGESLGGHDYVNGICSVCDEPNYGYSNTIDKPATPNYDYLAGTWYGEESGSADEGYAEYNTFIITLGADGKGTGIHSERGEFNVTYIGFYDGYTMICTNIGTIYVVYNEYTGAFTLRAQESFDVSLTKGDYLAMYKIAGVETDDDGDDVIEAPANLTEEYLEGTWSGIEDGGYTFTVTFEDGDAMLNHSYLGKLPLEAIVDGNKLHFIHPISYYQITLEYSNGTFTLSEFAYANFTGGSALVMIKGTTTPELPHEHVFVNGECECGEADPNYVPETPAFPENLTEEYLVGTWTGTEVSDAEYAITMTFDADGNLTITHAYYGGEVEVYDYYIEGNSIMIMCATENSSIALDYADGSLTLPEGAKGFVWGRTLTMTKAVEEEAPENLTEEYLVGTWTGTEVSDAEYAITMTFDADGNLTITHAYYGGNVEVYDYYIEGNSIMIMCAAENSSIALDYADGSLTLPEGAKGFVWGRTLTMTKA